MGGDFILHFLPKSLDKQGRKAYNSKMVYNVYKKCERIPIC